MRTKTTKKTIQKVERIVRNALEDRFGDEEMVFDPIIIEPRFDHYGDEFLRIFIIFDGDQKLLEPSWTVRLAGIILDQVTEDEMPGIPSKSFVEKSEWEEFLDLKEREPWIRMA